MSFFEYLQEFNIQLWYIEMFSEVQRFQIHKLYYYWYYILSKNLLQNAKTYRKWAALIINIFSSKNNLVNPLQTYRGRRIVFVTQNDPSWVIFTNKKFYATSIIVSVYYVEDIIPTWPLKNKYVLTW